MEPEDDIYFEWIFMIIRTILSMDNGNLEYLMKWNHESISKNVLELLFNGFNRIIDQRMQSSMIYGLDPNIKEIREQYNECKESGGRISICQSDLEWLVTDYQSRITKFIELYN